MSSLLTLFSIFLLLGSIFFTTTKAAFSEQSTISIFPNRMQKMTRLYFYFHDIVSGKNPTAVRIAGLKTKSGGAGSFGTTLMMDDPLTEGRELSSKLVGRAQGMYGLASQQGVALLMLLNFAFEEGKYNGSSLSIHGRNPVFDMVREMPVVGGSGVFRFANGYALAKTVWFNQKTADAVVEYNVTVLHF